MDVARPASVAKRKKMRRIAIAATGVVVVGLISFGLSRLEPAAPTVDSATLWRDTVKRGPMLRQVRGLGTLVPVDEARRQLPAVTQGRVERIVLRPGAEVEPDTVILELSEPQVQQAMAQQRMQAMQAGCNCGPGGYGGGMSEGMDMGPAPMGYTPGGMGGAVNYDNAQMPGYAWPSYASYPNYAAISYPQQYSPSAWPYIGPFYPYPQVPLGWRKVCLEWDDGWWFLDFSDCGSNH